MEQDSTFDESRERAVSSEPSSTRPNPFVDSDSTSRKRRRTSLAGSRSRSVETLPPQPETVVETEAEAEQIQAATGNNSTMKIDPPELVTPSTPPQSGSTPDSSPAGPHSSKVTINLRNIDNVGHAADSTSPTRSRPQFEEVKSSVEESEVEMVQALAGVDDIGSSPSAASDSDIPVELIRHDEEDDDVELVSIQSSAHHIDFNSIYLEFPYYTPETSLCDTVGRLTSFFTAPAHYDEVLSQLSDWIERYLHHAALDLATAVVAIQSALDVRFLWQSMPDLFAMVYTRRNILAKNPNTWNLTVHLFSFLPKLAAHLVKLDLRLLTSFLDNEQSSDFELFSPSWLVGLANITNRRTEEHVLNNSCPVEPIIDSSVLLNSFQKESSRESGYGNNDGSMMKLARLSEAVLHRLTRHPRKTMEYLTRICALAESIAIDSEPQLIHAATSSERSVLRSQRNSAVAIRMFQNVSEALRQVVEKFANHLGHELVPLVVTHLGSLLRVGLEGSSRDAADMLIGYRTRYPALPPAFAIDAYQSEWRLRLLTQMITSRQMQLRVVSLSHLATQLVFEWKKCQDYPREDGSMEYLRHLSHQLTATGLVAYLLGPTCHPEIIMDGFNVIGFLAVTNTYEPQHTDLFWQTMTTAQDPRISEALVRMMAKTVTHFTREPLEYLIQQMQSLSIDAFTSHMRELCDAIIKAIFQKHVDMISVVARLCLRLVQEASLNDSRGSPDHMVTFEFASIKLFDLLRFSANPALRQDLVQECLRDISAKSHSTTGSLHVLFRIIHPTMHRDLTILVREQEFPRLLVEELQASIMAGRTTGSNQVYASSLGQARRGLIEHVVAEHGAMIEPRYVEQFWQLLVGEEAISQEDRTTGWQSLNNAFKTAQHGNPFMRLCLQHHLPQLSPRLYCPGTLQFIRQALAPLANSITETDTALEGVDGPDNEPLELLWQIIIKAPPSTIEKQAINILVNDIYVKGKSIGILSHDRARRVHLILVNRCLQQMANAAKALRVEDTNLGSDDRMVISKDDEMLRQELVFTRSLSVLQEFVAALQDKSHHFAAPDLRSLMLQSPTVVEGEPADLKVQSFDGNEQTDVQPLTIGRQNTAASLLASIREATGFSNYRVFYRGAPLTPTEDQICKSLEELKIHTGLLLVKKESDAVSTSINIKPGASPLEIEILVHFQAFWDYLSMEERIAKEIYSFLVRLPADGSVLEAFENPSTSYLDVFPLGEPFKCLYTIHALREYLNTRRLRSKAMHANTQSTEADQSIVPEQVEALSKAIFLLVNAIEDPAVIDRCPTESLQLELSSHLVGTFVQLLKDSADSHDVVHTLTPKLQERLMALLSLAMGAQPSKRTTDVISLALEALLECCSRSTEFWDMFSQKPCVKKTVHDLLFADNRPFVRKNAGKLIKDKCTFTHGDSHVTPLQFTEMFWPIILELIPAATAEPVRCEEVFSLSYLLLQKMTEADSPLLDLYACIQQCADLIMSHTSTEDVSHPERVDIVAHGLGSILHYGINHFAEDGDVQLPPSFARKLFQRHLFPQEDAQGPLVPRVILTPNTRLLLTNIIIILTKDSDEQQARLFQTLNSLVAYDVETDRLPYRYDLPQAFERSKSVRAPGGYAGLKNLSNTCYLNSLFTQLYMNPNFRKFIMQVPVLDEAEHLLLSETQILFSELQDSMRRFIDPIACVGQIMNYDETPIDIGIQMDVDEFYNLLFDRWESQMPSTRAKQKFRSIYGGQLVQQVKSKECEHISERVEPFSAIQCDIKGIASLQESLQAYVDGEIMEGDNKYKCERCNRHVDAVKRACLKEVPDNVIFHLKRFSFDLRSLQRNKINDHFAFPQEIDLAPFKVEHLSNSSGATESDVFELVGVLVHSGTAEVGHYYSYIRERPHSGDQESWFEFNDDAVSQWDPTNLEGSCFGGKDPTSRFDGGIPYEKVYSAYMLFYQRASTLKRDQTHLKECGLNAVPRVDVKPELEETIKEDNWGIVHRYCTNDRSHITFVKAILERTWASPCSLNHKIENLAMHVALGHLDQIAARAKDIPDFQPLYSMIAEACQKCDDCGACLLDYFRTRTEATRMLLLRNADAHVRLASGSILTTVLRNLKARRLDDYEPPDIDLDCKIVDVYNIQPSYLTAGVSVIDSLFETFHTSLRAWPEFFHTMATFALMGTLEGAALLEQNYLIKLIMIITADTVEHEANSQYARLATTLCRRSRPPSFEAILAVIDILMGYLEPELDSQDFAEHPNGRMQLALEEQPICYTVDEINEIHREWPRTQHNIFVDKLIQHHQNFKATESIFRRLVDFGSLMERKICSSLGFGITEYQQSMPPVAAYLRATVYYIRWSHSEANVQYLIDHVCTQSSAPTSVEGVAYFHFFKKIFDMPRRSEQSEVSVQIKSINDIPKWAPALLGYIDPAVRSQTETLLEETLWAWASDPEVFEDDEDSNERARALIIASKTLTIACLLYLRDVYVKRNAQAPKDNVLPLQTTIQNGAAYFTPANATIGPELDIQFIQLKQIMLELNRLIVDEIEEDASDWDNSQGSSEPVDLGDA